MHYIELYRTLTIASWYYLGNDPAAGIFNFHGIRDQGIQEFGDDGDVGREG